MDLRRLKSLEGRPAAEFLRHRPPMLLLDRVVACEADSTVCEWTVTRRDAFTGGNDGPPAYVGIEYMAQCIGVHAGLRSRLDGLSPPMGFLLGTRHYTARLGNFRIGVSYRTTCRELMRDDNGMGSYECTIVRGDEVVAEGRLAVLEKERGSKSGV